MARSPAGRSRRSGHVTNGVHIPTWLGAPMRELLAAQHGEGWTLRTDAAERADAIDRIGASELWAAREYQRAAIRRVSARTQRRRPSLRARKAARARRRRRARVGGRHADDWLRAAPRATYKRIELLTRDPDWTLSLLGGELPVQVVLAGKERTPPTWTPSACCNASSGMKLAAGIAERVAFLDDYDLDTAARLVRGCDVWVNLPRPPLEASGTSGMKSAVNGGLQLSVLDGWWSRGLRRRKRLGAGWRGPRGRRSAGRRRRRDAASDPARGGRPELLRARRGRAAARLDRAHPRPRMRTILPAFGAERMLAQYLAGPYRVAR